MRVGAKILATTEKNLTKSQLLVAKIGMSVPKIEIFVARIKKTWPKFWVRSNEYFVVFQ